MANGYGYGGSSGSSSSSSSAPSSTPSSTPSSIPSSMPSGVPGSAAQSQADIAGKVAPDGFHYMPDGTLMSNAEHARLYGDKLITNFDLDLSDLEAASTTRNFSVNGNIDAEFSLEIKNEDNHYYNFVTNTFSSTKASLDKTLTSGPYRGSITFPKVTDNDQYDIYLYARGNTRHINYIEYRFLDGTLDINNSIGSNSLLMQKVIYQYTDLTLTLSTNSPSGTVETASQSNTVITTSRGKIRGSSAFSVACSVSTAAKVYELIKQPIDDDVLSFKTITVGSSPVALPGEDIWSGTARSTGKVVNGAVTSGTNVTMDDDVGTFWAVGDRITGNAALNAKTGEAAVTVTAINVGSNAKVFTMSEAIAIDNDETLTFTEPQYYSWSVDDMSNIPVGGILLSGDNVTANSKISTYENTVTLFADTEKEEKVIKDTREAFDTKGVKPTVTAGVVTAQEGNIIFDKQQKLSLAGDSIKIGTTGANGIFDLYGYSVKLTDLVVALTPITTTTTQAVVNSTSIPVASRNGILDNVSTITGIGIDTSTAVPTVSSGAGAVSGAGTIVLSAAQSLESGATLKVGNTGQTVTITGNIEIIKAGTASKTIYFDVDKLVRIT